jgi:hypothetical protein
MALLMAVLLLTLSPAAFAQDATPPVEPPTPIPSDTPVPPSDTSIPPSPTPLPPTDTETPLPPTNTDTHSLTPTSSETATTTQVQPAAQTPFGIATPVSETPPLVVWTPVFSDSFALPNLSDWLFGESGWGYEAQPNGDSALRVFNSMIPTFYQAASLANVAVEVTVDVSHGNAHLFAHHDGTVGYEVQLTSQGDLYLLRAGVVLLSTNLSDFRPLEPHRLQLNIYRNQLWVDVDGQTQVTIMDTAPLPAGRVGIAASFPPVQDVATPAPPQNTVVFDDFVLYQPVAQVTPSLVPTHISVPPTPMPSMTATASATATAIPDIGLDEMTAEASEDLSVDLESGENVVMSSATSACAYPAPAAGYNRTIYDFSSGSQGFVPELISPNPNLAVYGGASWYTEGPEPNGVAIRLNLPVRRAVRQVYICTSVAGNSAWDVALSNTFYMRVAHSSAGLQTHSTGIISPQYASFIYVFWGCVCIQRSELMWIVVDWDNLPDQTFTPTITPTPSRTYTPSITPTYLPLSPVNTNLITNGDFSNGLTNWITWNSTASVVSGRLEIARNTGTTDGGFYQTINSSISANAPLELTLQMGNRSSVNKQVNIVLRDGGWRESFSCPFTLPARSPLQTYTMRVRTTRFWSPLVFQGWLQNPDGAQALQVDNVNLQYKPNLNITGTSCVVSPPASTNLIYNGDFAQGTTNWATFNAAMQVVNTGGANGNVMELARWNNTPDGGFYQYNPYAAPANGVFQFNFQMGNQSSVARTVNVVVRNPEWTDVHNCFITLAPNTLLTNYQITLRASLAWSNLVVQGWIQVGDYNGTPPLPFRFDNLSLQYLPNGTSAPTVCPTSQPTPTPTPTGGICPQGSPQQGGTTSSCQPTCNIIGITLDDFRIVLEGNWSATERTEILVGVQETGRALCLHGAATTDVAAFGEVLQGQNSNNEWRSIVLRRVDRDAEAGDTVDGDEVYCATNKTPDNPTQSASIECDLDVIMTQYTMVHELGHVLVGRTTLNGNSLYLTLIQTANLRDSNNSHIMGFQRYSLENLGTRSDWQRSRVFDDNGWGSAALWNQTSYYVYQVVPPPTPSPTYFPLYIPRVGPCGPGAPTTLLTPTGTPSSGTPFPFQQNPCNFPDWETTDPVGFNTEIEEAAADMFLNWIYWKNFPGQTSGFLDRLWRDGNCYPSGCPDPGASGQARAEWMNQTMTALYTQFGW